MKKLVFRITLSAGSLLAATGFTDAQQGLMLGVEATPQLSWLTNKDDNSNSDFKYVTTFNSSFGITGQYGFTKILGIGLNVLYSFQGQRYQLSGIENYKKVDYVKIPLMFVYSAVISSNVMFIGKIGPELEILSMAKLTDKNNNTLVIDVSSAYQSTNISGVIHAGFSFKLTELLMLDATLRYDYDFADAEMSSYKTVVNNPSPSLTRIPLSTTTTRNASTYNMTAGVSVGLKYLFK